ncbi:hypothetical protein FQN54_001713 [Arachnomyces sp. PD_36]|nr:hypothetical protein FQN54_001713 [Arachnomyces sp. PD_36]
MQRGTISVPKDMLALRAVREPFYITVPGNAEITVTGHTNARFYQKVTVTDVTGGQTYIFTGSGEREKVMAIDGSSAQSQVTLDSLESKPLYRTLYLSFEYSPSGSGGKLQTADVLAPRTRSEYDGPHNLKQISWEISSEDGQDKDFDDSVIQITAHINKDLRNNRPLV